MSSTRAVMTVTTAATVLAVVGVVSVATGAIPGSDGRINACHGSNGEVRVIDAEKFPPQTCNKGWKPLSWNQTGPTGDDGVDGQDGARGEPGPRGPSNAYGTFKDSLEDLPNGSETYDVFDFGSEAIVTLPLPAGSFHIQAKGFASGEAGNVGCVLVAGADIDGSLATLPGDRTVEPLVMQVLHHFSQPGQAELRCTDYGGSTRGLFWIKVHATQVESITNPPAP
jgi:hypothetical protein